jgi:hypothetical protein
MAVEEYYRDGKLQKLDIGQIESIARSGQKIPLIKEFRRISGLGLKDSKDTIEKYQTSLGYDIDDLINEFRLHAGQPAVEPITKEEFLNMVEHAIDTMDTFHYTDMAEAVEAMVTNIRKKGGINAIAKERSRFLNGI